VLPTAIIFIIEALIGHVRRPTHATSQMHALRSVYRLYFTLYDVWIRHCERLSVYPGRLLQLARAGGELNEPVNPLS